jgi:hypothetical protein
LAAVHCCVSCVSLSHIPTVSLPGTAHSHSLFNTQLILAIPPPPLHSIFSSLRCARPQPVPIPYVFSPFSLFPFAAPLPILLACRLLPQLLIKYLALRKNVLGSPRGIIPDQDAFWGTLWTQIRTKARYFCTKMGISWSQMAHSITDQEAFWAIMGYFGPKSAVGFVN